jgi:hypothetical protein
MAGLLLFGILKGLTTASLVASLNKIKFPTHKIALHIWANICYFYL